LERERENEREFNCGIEKLTERGSVCEKMSETQTADEEIRVENEGGDE